MLGARSRFYAKKITLDDVQIIIWSARDKIMVGSIRSKQMPFPDYYLSSLRLVACIQACIVLS